jgi:DNA-binding response OmpR family regulator
LSPNFVLLVEDNLDHAALVQAVLEYHGLGRHVNVAATLAEAKAYLLGEWPFEAGIRNPRPDLIILDHWLDDGTGLDFLAWIQGQDILRSVPVIVFTGCRDPEVRSRALELGARDFLLKPDGFDGLGVAIRRLVRADAGVDAKNGRNGPSSAKAG